MYSLAEKLSDPSGFVLGIELVTTRGTMADAQAMHTRAFAAELVRSNDIDWVSITDNAGGNPQLAPTALRRLPGGRLSRPRKANVRYRFGRATEDAR